MAHCIMKEYIAFHQYVKPLLPMVMETIFAPGAKIS